MAKSGKPWRMSLKSSPCNISWEISSRLFSSTCQNNQKTRAWAQLWEADEIQPLIWRFRLSDTKRHKIRHCEKYERECFNNETHYTTEKITRLPLFHTYSQIPDLAKISDQADRRYYVLHRTWVSPERYTDKKLQDLVHTSLQNWRSYLSHCI